MPEDRYLQAPLRPSRIATIVAVCLCAAPAFAQSTAQPAVNDRQVQSFFNGIALDQQMAEQYPVPASQASAAQRAAAVAPPPAQLQRAPTPRPLDKPLDEAIDDAAMDKLEADVDEAVAGGAHKERATIAEAPLSPVRTVLVLLAGLAVLAFAGSALSMAVRELKKDAEQRKRTQRRRVKPHDQSTPAHAS